MELNAKDWKILFELDKDSRVSLAELGKKVRLSKEVVFHRLNNLTKSGVILRFQTLISTYRLGYKSFKIYFKLQNMTAEVRSQMQKFLIHNEAVYWVGNCQGRWDLIVAVWAKDIQEFGRVEDEILNIFSNYILDKEVTISRRSLQFNRRWFRQGKSDLVETSFGEGLEEIKLDKTDLAILKYMANNARIKLVELADRTKVSVTVIRYRLKQLESKGVILGYKYALNSKLLGYETCKAFVYFKNITEERRKRLIAYCKELPNTLNIIQTIGPWDMEIEFEVKNFEEYYQIMSEVQERHSDIIKGYDSVLFSSEPKQSFMPEAY